MSAVFMLMPLAFTFVLYALLLKLAAKIYRRSMLPWKHAFAFGAMVIVLGTAGAFLVRSTDSGFAPFVVMATGLAMHLGLGGWYLGRRTRSPTGEPIAFKGGVLVAAIAYGIVIVFTLIAAMLVPILGGESLH